MNESKSSRGHIAPGYRLRLFLYTLIGLVVADGLITEFLVKSRFASEGNPFLEQWVGGNYFLVLKAAGAILAALVLWNIGKRSPKLAAVATLCFLIIYTAIIFWNLSVYFLA
jgi:O-antigen ligase